MPRRAERDVGRVEDPPRRDVREEHQQVRHAEPRRVEEDVRVAVELAPDPREVAHARVREDELRARELRRELEHVRAERRDPAARVDEDRQPPLVRLGDDVAHGRLVEPELLRARVELDPARTRRDAAADLGDGVVARVDPAERDQPALGCGGRRDDVVVRGRVAVGLVHRERHGAPVGGRERGEQLVRGARERVGVVDADVRVRVERPQRPCLRQDLLVPRRQQVVGVHGRPV